MQNICIYILYFARKPSVSSFSCRGMCRESELLDIFLRAYSFGLLSSANSLSNVSFSKVSSEMIACSSFSRSAFFDT